MNKYKPKQSNVKKLELFLSKLEKLEKEKKDEFKFSNNKG